MYGALPLSLLLDLASSNGIGIQKELPLHTPKFFINPEYLTTVPVGWSNNMDGLLEDCSSSFISHVDHPAFDNLRRHLGAKGYIKIEDGYWNGDVVLNKFILNDCVFQEGDKFPCSSAVGVMLKCYKQDETED